MKPSTVIFALAALAATLQPSSLMVQSYTNPIAIKGYKMFDAKTGEYFSARGIDYYPRPNTGELDENNIDFFTDDYYDIWSKDIEHLAKAGANAIRLYAVDPSKSHDKFMCALRAKGIYVLVDLGASCEGCGITKDKYPACYPPALKNRGEQIILAFAKYDNVLGFSAGNEINHVVGDATTNAPCQKKFLRDMRAFIGSCSSKMRSVPVGVVLADHERKNNALYYNCRTDASDKYENAEWYGLNAYQYCDATVVDMAKATGMTEMVSDFQSYKTSIPVMLTEFGCVNPSFPTTKGYEAQRTWSQAGWLHSPEFRKVFSGGFAFEFSTENANSKGDSPFPFSKFGEQNYGLGYYSPATCDHTTTPCTYNPMPNYDSLAKQYTAVDTSKEPRIGAFKPESDRAAPPKCPSGFASLKSIAWSTDAAKSNSCPDKPVAFTCPGQKSSGVWAGAASSNASASSNSSSSRASSNSTDDDDENDDSEAGVVSRRATPKPSEEAAPTPTPNDTLTGATSSAPAMRRTLATSTLLAVGLSTAAAALFL